MSQIDFLGPDVDRRFSPVLGLILAVGLLGGCASVAIEDAVPQSALATASTETSAEIETADEATADEAPGQVGVTAPVLRDTGQFPNLNVPRKGAAEQLSAGETSARKGELRRSASGQSQAAKGQTIQAADAERLRRLGATHAEHVLKEIEGE